MGRIQVITYTERQRTYSKTEREAVVAEASGLARRCARYRVGSPLSNER